MFCKILQQTRRVSKKITGPNETLFMEKIVTVFLPNTFWSLSSNCSKDVERREIARTATHNDGALVLVVLKIVLLEISPACSGMSAAAGAVNRKPHLLHNVASMHSLHSQELCELRREYSWFALLL